MSVPSGGGVPSPGITNTPSLVAHLMTPNTLYVLTEDLDGSGLYLSEDAGLACELLFEV